MFSSSKTPDLTWAQEIKEFFIFWDQRFCAYKAQNPWLMLMRDGLAGLVVALVAIPLGIGFSIASGMTPQQGIIAGAVAGLIGGIFGGSRFQVYGPTAAFIPIISGIVSHYGTQFLILASIIAGVVICLMGVGRLGKYFSFVPHSIIVGFTMGIAASIVASQLPNVLGERGPVSYHFVEKVKHLPDMFQDAHGHAIVIAIFTFFFIKKMVKISVFIPGALLSMMISTFVANYIWHEHMIPVVATQYDDIGKNMFAFTPPSLGSFAISDLFVPVFSIILIGSLESLLSSRMADRLANNTVAPYNPNKELFGQGVVNIVVPLLNGFPVTGALARTATNIRLGAVSPMASLCKGTFVIVLMLFFAPALNMVPMACVGGLLMYVASNMVKAEEVKEVVKSGRLDLAIMIYTALVTVLTDLSFAVVSATILHYTINALIKRTQAAVPADSVVAAVAKEELPPPTMACPNCGYEQGLVDSR